MLVCENKLKLDFLSHFLDFTSIGAYSCTFSITFSQMSHFSVEFYQQRNWKLNYYCFLLFYANLNYLSENVFRIRFLHNFRILIKYFLMFFSFRHVDDTMQWEEICVNKILFLNLKC